MKQRSSVNIGGASRVEMSTFQLFHAVSLTVSFHAVSLTVSFHAVSLTVSFHAVSLTVSFKIKLR